MGHSKLSKLELQILEALWAHGKAAIREIQECFPEPRPAYTTIQTTVYRMEKKNAVRRVRKIGNADIFEPMVARDVAWRRIRRHHAQSGNPLASPAGFLFRGVATIVATSRG